MSSAAETLLEGMRRTKNGWGADDLRTLYLGFGFSCREGRKHRVYIHAEYSDLRATVARQRQLPVGYVQHAVSLIGRLERLKSEKASGAGGHYDCHGAR
jgi:hypothetical protein